jgi:hypothetical protein
VRRVIVHIDRLVLRGVRYEGRQALAEGLQAELARVLSGRATPAGIGPFRKAGTVDAGRLSVRRSASPATIGAKAAQSIGKAILS